MRVFLVLGLVGFGLRKGCRVVVLARLVSQREQALGALNALIQVLGPEIEPQVKGLVEGLLHQKPASPIPRPLMLKWWPAFLNLMILKRR